MPCGSTHWNRFTPVGVLSLLVRVCVKGKRETCTISGVCSVTLAESLTGDTFLHSAFDHK